MFLFQFKQLLNKYLLTVFIEITMRVLKKKEED